VLRLLSLRIDGKLDSLRLTLTSSDLGSNTPAHYLCYCHSYLLSLTKPFTLSLTKSQSIVAGPRRKSFADSETQITKYGTSSDSTGDAPGECELSSIPTTIGDGAVTTSSLQALQSSDQRGMMDLVDKLRRQGLSSEVELPQLVVCGDQSSGRSSVLEGFTEIPFPRKENLCTRFATEVSKKARAAFARTDFATYQPPSVASFHEYSYHLPRQIPPTL